MHFELWDWLIQILLIPLYMVLGTARHEYAHIICCKFEGVKVRYVSCLPHWGKFIWDGAGTSYVHKFTPEPGLDFRMGVFVWEGTIRPGKLVFLMPYIVAVAFAAIGFYVVPKVLDTQGVQAWLSAIVLFWISPALDVIYNVWKWIKLKRGDLEKVFPHGRD